MNKRIFLGSLDHSGGNIWFTLVFEYGSEIFVERYNDSKGEVGEKRLKKIPSNEFSKYEIHGIPLKQLVDEQFKAIQYAD